MTEMTVEWGEWGMSDRHIGLMRKLNGLGNETDSTGVEQIDRKEAGENQERKGKDHGTTEE